MRFNNSRKSWRSTLAHLPTTRHQNRRLSLEPLEHRCLLTLIGVSTSYPEIAYDSTGKISYNPTSEAFDFTATPLTYRQSSTSVPISISIATNGLQLHILVNNSGQLVQSSTSDTFALDGSVVVSGTVSIPAHFLPVPSVSLVPVVIYRFRYRPIRFPHRSDRWFAEIGFPECELGYWHYYQ